MLLDFSGLNAFVTGGTNGIGLACSRVLAEGGARVTIFDLEPNTPEIPGAVGIAGDVRNSDALAKAMQQCAGDGSLDIVVVNAGMVAPAKLLETDDADW